MLKGRGIHAAFGLSVAEDGWVRKRMGAVGLRTVLELRGTACLELDEMPSPKQATSCTRTFGRAVTDKDDLLSAIVTFASRAAEKARRTALPAA